MRQIQMMISFLLYECVLGTTCHQRLPVLPNGRKWIVDVNTNVEYKDDENFMEKTEVIGENTIRVPGRTTIILVAE